MPTITVAAFAGAIPRISSRLLESQNARDCVNCDLDSGALRALHGPEKVLALPDPAGTIFKHDTDGWLHWPGEVSVVKSAVLDTDGEKPLGQLLVTGDRAYPTMYLAEGGVSSWYSPSCGSPDAGCRSRRPTTGDGRARLVCGPYRCRPGALWQ